MKKAFYLFLLLLPIIAKGQLLVYTVAGSDSATTLGDSGPATSALMGSDEGIWLDGSCNVYISDDGNNRIRKVSAETGIITTIAGDGTGGASTGDGGHATSAGLYNTYGIYADAQGNVYITEIGSNRIRRVDAVTGIITTFAGGGTSLSDGVPATDAQLNDPHNVYGDDKGNIYIGEYGFIKKIDTFNVISTIAGTGTVGYTGDGGQATNAQINIPHGMLYDDSGNFYFADRGNSIIRKINPSGIITTFAGTPGVFGYSGDGGPATAAQLSGPISFVIDNMSNMIIGDNQNNCMRKVDAITGIITTIAGIDTAGGGTYAEGAPATNTNMHPEFMYLDRSGNIYYSCYCNQVRKVAHYNPGELYGANNCEKTAVPQAPANSSAVEIYPNPASEEVTIASPGLSQGEEVVITNVMGQKVETSPRPSPKEREMSLNISGLPLGVYFVKVNGVYAGKFVKE